MKKRILLPFVAFVLCLFMITPALAAEGKMNVAVICGTDAAKNSAAKMDKILAKNKMPQWRLNKHVPYYYDCAKRPSSRSSVDKVLDSAFGGSTSSDINYLYVAAHGYSGTSESNKVVYANTGLILGIDAGAEKGVYRFQDLAKKLVGYKGQFVVIMDCCFAENFYTSGIQQYKDHSGRFTVFCSSAQNEYAWGIGHTQFYSLNMANGLTYKSNKKACGADKNKDGFITVKELHNSVKWPELSSVHTYGNTKTELFQFGYLKLSKKSVSVNLDEKKTYNLGSSLKKYNCASKQTVKWKSSNPAVASVNKSGKVTAKKAGSAVITAYLADKNGKMCLGSEASCTVNVKRTKIKLSKTSLTLNKGKSAKITATITGTKKKASWSSSNSAVASVSKGKITAKKAGTAVITAKVNGKTAKCKVTVKKSDYKALYKSFLEKSQVKAGNRSIKPGWFYMLNIDKKGVPELIVTEKTAFPTVTYYVYTVKNGAVKYMGECSLKGMSAPPTLQYSSKYKGIYVGGWINGVGGSWSALYGVSGTKLVRKQHSEEYHSSGDTYYTGTTDGQSKRVTRSQCQAFVKKYFGDLKKYTMKANTAANRNRAF